MQVDLQQQSLITTGPTGVGKTWLACAFAQQAARRGLPVLYRRLPRLLEELEIARETGGLPECRIQLVKIKLPVLDGAGIVPVTPRDRQDLMETIDDRSRSGSLVIKPQLPIAEWRAYLGSQTRSWIGSCTVRTASTFKANRCVSCAADHPDPNADDSLSYSLHLASATQDVVNTGMMFNNYRYRWSTRPEYSTNGPGAWFSASAPGSTARR